MEDGREGMKIELVLKEYIDVNPSRELRCFVRNNILIGKTDISHDHLMQLKSRYMSTRH